MADTLTAASRPRGLSRRGRVLAWVLGTAAVLALAAWVIPVVLTPHPPSPERITQQMKAQAALTGGAQTYATYCAYCHSTGFGPSIAHLGLPAEAMRSIVRAGPAMMPAFAASELSDADIAGLTDFLDSLPPPEQRS